ncbi:MAG: nucleotidyltransferase family protein [Eubacteriales bacterium]|nr:nucleotidyltransferase family protein [Eubacteriales bacterium]
MSITAIIAEYNPFHNGHLYQIQEAKKLTGCDHIIAVMSGNFVQRGEPAVMDKFQRSFCALSAGLDAVFELPVGFSTASAEAFAAGAISLLNGLGCVDFLCFGSEYGSLDLLKMIADILVSEPDSYLDGLRQSLKNGLSFPASRENSLWNYLKNISDSNISSLPILSDRNSFSAFLSMPNNILGIEYLKSLKKSGSSITPVTIRRKGNDYHDLSLSGLCSASAIRNVLNTENLPADIKISVPESTASVIQDQYHISLPVYIQDFSMMLRYRLLNLTCPEELLAYADVSEDLARRIFSFKSDYRDYSSFISLVKTKNVTESNVRRALIHILLGIRKTDMPQGNEQVFFARLLGMRKNTNVLSIIKKNSRLPILTKPADACSFLIKHYSDDNFLLSESRRQLSDSIRSSEIFHGAICEKYHSDPYNEFRQSPVIL